MFPSRIIAHDYTAFDHAALTFQCRDSVSQMAHTRHQDNLYRTPHTYRRAPSSDMQRRWPATGASGSRRLPCQQASQDRAYRSLEAVGGRLGGRAKNVVKRIVEYGAGGIPPYIPPYSSISPEQIRHGRDTLNELATQAGRDPTSIQIVTFSWLPDGAAVKAFEAAGADAVRIGLEAAGEKEALAKLEEIAQQMLG